MIIGGNSITKMVSSNTLTFDLPDSIFSTNTQYNITVLADSNNGTSDPSLPAIVSKLLCCCGEKLMCIKSISCKDAYINKGCQLFFVLYFIIFACV